MTLTLTVTLDDLTMDMLFSKMTSFLFKKKLTVEHKVYMVSILINDGFFSILEGIQISTPPSPGSVVVNKTAFMYCQASYNSRMFDVSYTWRLNGHLIDMENSAHYVQVRSLNIVRQLMIESYFSMTVLCAIF